MNIYPVGQDVKLYNFKSGNFTKGANMQHVEPKVYLIGESTVVKDGLNAFLSDYGVPDWKTDATSDVELLPEVYGRLCYRSFDPKLNPNLTKVRKGNKSYIANIIKSQHGSVLEHSSINFIFKDVSRVFTHELVRHRLGVAVSQESLRYIRLTEMKMWAPTVIKENSEAMEIFVDAVEKMEDAQVRLNEVYKLDDPKTSFMYKKTVTSALRRVAPFGIYSTIGWTVNLRALRWIIELRTSPHAEEEIRLVFNMVGDIVMDRYPNVFSDFKKIKDDDGDLFWFKPENSKI